MGETATRYSPGDLRIVRDVRANPSAEHAYVVEEARAPHRRVSEPKKPISEKAALLLMRELGSPYPGDRYPDDPFLPHPGRHVAQANKRIISIGRITERPATEANGEPLARRIMVVLPSGFVTEEKPGNRGIFEHTLGQIVRGRDIIIYSPEYDVQPLIGFAEKNGVMVEDLRWNPTTLPDLVVNFVHDEKPPEVPAVLKYNKNLAFVSIHLA